MKILLTMIVFLSVLGAMKAQNGDAPALPINWNDTTAFIPNQNEFYLGYHWSGQRKKGNELLHSNHFFDTWGGLESRNLRLGNIPNDGKKKSLVWAVLNNGAVNYFFPAIQFDPTAPIHRVIPWDDQVKEILHPRDGDTTAAIFGFAYRDSTFGSLPASGNVNFDRYVLTKTGVPDTGKLSWIMPHFNPPFSIIFRTVIQRMCGVV
ncbi:MAG: hypothetical protein IPM69_13080 [Ignavibacteria bacterium]|nr:hypothetical protein [Ignavibacteria bacterium]